MFDIFWLFFVLNFSRPPDPGPWCLKLNKNLKGPLWLDAQSRFAEFKQRNFEKHFAKIQMELHFYVVYDLLIFTVYVFLLLHFLNCICVCIHLKKIFNWLKRVQHSCQRLKCFLCSFKQQWRIVVLRKTEFFISSWGILLLHRSLRETIFCTFCNDTIFFSLSEFVHWIEELKAAHFKYVEQHIAYCTGTSHSPKEHCSL